MLEELTAGRGGRAAAQQAADPALRGQGRARHLLLRLRPHRGRGASGGTGEDPADDPGWFFVIKERPGRAALRPRRRPHRRRCRSSTTWPGPTRCRAAPPARTSAAVEPRHVDARRARARATEEKADQHADDVKVADGGAERRAVGVHPLPGARDGRRPRRRDARDGRRMTDFDQRAKSSRRRATQAAAAASSPRGGRAAQRSPPSRRDASASSPPDDPERERLAKQRGGAEARGAAREGRARPRGRGGDRRDARPSARTPTRARTSAGWATGTRSCCSPCGSRRASAATRPR